MKTAVKKKTVEQAESAPAPVEDDPRAPLRQAIAYAWKCITQVTAQTDAIERCESLIVELEDKRALATKKISVAIENDTETVATAIRKRSIAKPDAAKKARQAEADLTERLALAEAALKKLRAQLEEKTLALNIAQNRVIIERTKLVAPIAAAAIERVKALKLEIAAHLAALNGLLLDKSPDFGDRSLAHSDAQRLRDAAFGDLKIQASRFALSGQTIEEFNRAQAITAAWTSKLAELKKNADADIGKV